MLLLDSVPNSWHLQCQCQKSLFANRIVKRVWDLSEENFCSNNMNVNSIATSKVRQDVEEFSRLAAKVGADFTAGHHVGVAAAAALVKRGVSCALSFLSPFIQFQFNWDYQANIISTLRLKKYIYYICR